MYVLDKSVFDHCTIVFKNSQIDCGPKPFRSLDVWKSYKGFKELRSFGKVMS